MRVSGWFSVLCGGVVVAMAAPVVAHHSFAAEFDINRPIKLDGVVTKMQFSNPHSWLHIEVTTESGEKQQWAVEGGAPNALIRHGWNRNSVPAGTRVHVEGFQAKDRSFRASGRSISGVKSLGASITPGLAARCGCRDFESPITTVPPLAVAAKRCLEKSYGSRMHP